jgi:hypothetical protein
VIRENPWLISFRGLTLPAGDHQTSPDDNQNDARDGWNLLIVVRRNAHMRVAHADAMMFGMRERHEERNDP